MEGKVIAERQGLKDLVIFGRRGHCQFCKGMFFWFVLQRALSVSGQVGMYSLLCEDYGVGPSYGVF